MYRRLDLYLFRQLAAAWAIIALVLTLVFVLVLSFRALSLVVENAGTALVFLQLIGLTIPTFLPVLLPVSVAVAVIFMIHKLATDSELVVMHAVGISLGRIMTPIIALGLVVTLVGMLISTVVAPWANRELVKLQYEVKNNVGIFLLRAGTFNDIVPGLTFYARKRDSSGGLEGILIHDTRKPAVPITIMAERGMMIMRAKDEPRLIVFNGIRQEFKKDTKELTELRFDNYTFDLRLLRGNIINRAPDPRELSMLELFDPSDDLINKTSYTTDRLKAEAHQRLANPWLSLTVSCMALALLLYGEFNRRGLDRRMTVAVASVIFMLAIQLWLTNLAAKSLGFVPLLYGLNAIGLLIAGILLAPTKFKPQPLAAPT